jgi:hypothetical protein
MSFQTPRSVEEMLTAIHMHEGTVPAQAVRLAPLSRDLSLEYW